MPRPKNTSERRSQIARAMMGVMAEHGYEGASIARIAAAAGLTQGLLHYHFRSKAEILEALLEELVSLYTARLERALAEAGPHPADQLGAFIDVHLGLGAYADPQALACWVFLGGEALRSARVRERYEAALGETVWRLARILRRGVTAGRFRCDDTAAAAGAITATIQGYFLMGATARELFPRGSAAAATRRMAAGLLGEAPDGSDGGET